MNIFKLDNISLNVPATTQLSAMENIAQTAVTLGYANNAADVVIGMQEREALSSTALMDGIAIPHAKRNSIVEPALIIQRYSAPIDWDGEPVIITLAMLVPEAQAGSTHLEILAAVSRALIDDDVRAGLVSAPTPEAVFGVLAPHLPF